MGNTLAGPQQDVISLLQADLPEFLLMGVIGRGKFLKTALVKRNAADSSVEAGAERGGAAAGAGSAGAAAAAGSAAGGAAGPGASAAPAASAASGKGGSSAAAGASSFHLPPDDSHSAAIGERAVVKVYLKRSDAKNSGDVARRIAAAREQLLGLCSAFSVATHPGVFPYQRFKDAPRSDAAYLLRQHFLYSLYDRLHSRPFMTPIEKRWAVYQLLRAVEQAHTANVRHGDIKTENVMVTSWGWVVLTDFALFKPVFIPEDHPADFYYFFEAGSRRRCYIAPERFVKERELLALGEGGGGGGFGGEDGATGGGEGLDALLDGEGLEGLAGGGRSVTRGSVAAPGSGRPGGSSLPSMARAPSVFEPAGEGEAAGRAAAASVAAASGAASAPRKGSVQPQLSRSYTPSIVAGGGAAAASAISSSQVAQAPPLPRGPSDPRLKESMDVFATGCVIAETLLDGEPIFDLSSLLRYRAGGSGAEAAAAAPAAGGSGAAVPASGAGAAAGAQAAASTASTSAATGASNAPSGSGAASTGAADVDAGDPLSKPSLAAAWAACDPAGQYRALIRSMIARDPRRRKAAGEYLTQGTGDLADDVAAAVAAASSATAPPTKPLFPAFFPFVYDLFSRLLLHDLAAPDARVLAVAAHYPLILRNVGVGLVDPIGERILAHRLALEPPHLVQTASFPVRNYYAEACTRVASSGVPSGPPAPRGIVVSHPAAVPDLEAHVRAKAASAAHTAAAKATLEALETLRWEWGSLPGAEWGTDGFAGLPDATVAEAGRVFEGTSLLALHEPWTPLRYRLQAKASSVASSSCSNSSGAPALSRSSSSTSTSSGGTDAAVPRAVQAVDDDPVPGGAASATAATSSGSSSSGGLSHPLLTSSSLLDRAHGLVAEAERLGREVGSTPEDAAATAASPAATKAAAPAAAAPAAASASAPASKEWVLVAEPLLAPASSVVSPPTAAPEAGGGFTLVIVLLTSCLRHVSNPRTKLTCIFMLSRLCPFTDDETRLQRVVPFLVSQLTDPAAPVRAHALCALAIALDAVRAFPATDAVIFPEYVFPALKKFPLDPEPLVQTAAAECVPRLAAAAQRFAHISEVAALRDALTKAEKAEAAAAAVSGPAASPVLGSLPGPGSSSGPGRISSSYVGSPSLRAFAVADATSPSATPLLRGSLPSTAAPPGPFSLDSLPPLPPQASRDSALSPRFSIALPDAGAVTRGGPVGPAMAPLPLPGQSASEKPAPLAPAAARVAPPPAEQGGSVAEAVTELLKDWGAAAMRNSVAGLARPSVDAGMLAVLRAENRLLVQARARLASGVSAFGAAGAGDIDVSFDSSDVFSPAMLRRLSEGFTSLPLALDPAPVKRAILASLAPLVSILGRQALDQGLLTWVLTLSHDALRSRVLQALGPALVPLVIPHASDDGPVPIAVPPHVAHRLQAEIADAGNPATTPELMALLMRWLNLTGIHHGDWQLRDTFMQSLVQVAHSLGRGVTESQLLLFLEAEQGVLDAEEQVAHRALVSMAELVSAGLVSRRTAADRVGRYASLALHPGAWVRAGALRLVAAGWAALGWPAALQKTATAVNPLLAPAAGDRLWARVCALLTRGSTDGAALVVSLEAALASALVPPISRARYERDAGRVAAAAAQAASSPLAARVHLAKVAALIASSRRSAPPTSFTHESGFGGGFSAGAATPNGDNGAAEVDDDRFSDSEGDGFWDQVEEADEDPVRGERKWSSGVSGQGGKPSTHFATTAYGPGADVLPPPGQSPAPSSAAAPSPSARRGGAAASSPSSPDPRIAAASKLRWYIQETAGAYVLQSHRADGHWEAIRRLYEGHHPGGGDAKVPDGGLDDDDAGDDDCGAFSSAYADEDEVLVGNHLPTFPYLDEELASVPVRSVSVPDQRYASVHPSPPPAAAAKDVDPQAEPALLALVGPGLEALPEAVLPPADDALVLASKRHGSGLPLTIRSRAVAAFGEDALTSPGEAAVAALSQSGGLWGAVDGAVRRLHTPALRYAAAATPPRVGDLPFYAAKLASLQGAHSSTVHRCRLSYLTTHASPAGALSVTLEDPAAGALVVAGAVGSPLGSPWDATLPGGNGPARRFSSFSGAWASRTSVAARPASAAQWQLGPPRARSSSGEGGAIDAAAAAAVAHGKASVSALSAGPLTLHDHHRSLRKAWRRAGRAARLLHLRHGVWEPLLASDPAVQALASQQGVESTSAFFYRARGIDGGWPGAAVDDPTLYASDDEEGSGGGVTVGGAVSGAGARSSPPPAADAAAAAASSYYRTASVLSEGSEGSDPSAAAARSGWTLLDAGAEGSLPNGASEQQHRSGRSGAAAEPSSGFEVDYLIDRRGGELDEELTYADDDEDGGSGGVVVIGRAADDANNDPRVSPASSSVRFTSAAQAAVTASDSSSYLARMQAAGLVVSSAGGAGGSSGAEGSGSGGGSGSGAADWLPVAAAGPAALLSAVMTTSAGSTALGRAYGSGLDPALVNARTAASRARTLMRGQTGLPGASYSDYVAGGSALTRAAAARVDAAAAAAAAAEADEPLPGTSAGGRAGRRRAAAAARAAGAGSGSSTRGGSGMRGGGGGGFPGVAHPSRRGLVVLTLGGAASTGSGLASLSAAAGGGIAPLTGGLSTITGLGHPSRRGVASTPTGLLLAVADGSFIASAYLAEVSIKRALRARGMHAWRKPGSGGAEASVAGAGGAAAAAATGGGGRKRRDGSGSVFAAPSGTGAAIIPGYAGAPGGATASGSGAPRRSSWRGDAAAILGAVNAALGPDPASKAPSGIGVSDDRDYLSPDALLSLKRRVAALELPPLPPDMGRLHKASDPPAPILAHAVRVAVNLTTPDSVSTACVGVGSGMVDGTALAAAAGAGVSVALDELPKLSVDDPDRAVGAPLHPGAVELTPLPIPVPQSEAIVRPSDVGDGTGYLGAGPVSFLGVARDWSDAVGVSTPFNSAAGLVAPAEMEGTSATSGSYAADADSRGGEADGSGGSASGSGGAEAAGSSASSGGARGSSSGSAGAGGAGSAAATGGAPAAANAGAGGQSPSGSPAAGTAASSGASVSSAWDRGDGTWGSRPRGLLLSTASEHTGPVTAVSTCQDHSFFVTGSEDGTVRVWASRGLDVDVSVTSLITYTGHLQETRFGDRRRGIVPGRNPVTDVIVCDNSTSIASGSLAGTVHIYRVDVPGARADRATGGFAAAEAGQEFPHARRRRPRRKVVGGTSSSTAASGGVPGGSGARGSGSGARGGSAGPRGTSHGSSTSGSGAATAAPVRGSEDGETAASAAAALAAAAGDGRYAGGASFGAGSDGGASSSAPPDEEDAPSGAEEDDDDGASGPAPSDEEGGGEEDDVEADALYDEDGVDGASVRCPPFAYPVRRLVYSPAEGGVAALRHYNTATASILVVAMENGVIHGSDLRSRTEAWEVRLPPAAGRITALELAPGCAAALVGTDRGVVAVIDTRFHMVIAAWRHSAKTSIRSLHPYVTVDVRVDAATGAAHGERLDAFTTLLGTGGVAPSGAGTGMPLVPLARQLAVGVCTGSEEVAFFNLESGVCTRLLRSLPGAVPLADAAKLPYLLRLRVVGGRLLSDEDDVDADDAAGAGPRALLAAARDWGRCLPPRAGMRALLCPLPTSSSQGLSLMSSLRRVLGGWDASSDAAARLADGSAAVAPTVDPLTALAALQGGTGSGSVTPGARGGAGSSAGAAPSAANAAAAAAAAAALAAGGLPGSGSSSGGGSSGLGFVLGGMRGAGAARRKDGRFGVAYVTGGGGSEAGAGTLAYVYGGSSLEGLPVWMLTAGSDAHVRCWDLERPRASHTVVGLAPGEVRDGYQGAWLQPPPGAAAATCQPPHGLLEPWAGEEEGSGASDELPRLAPDADASTSSSSSSLPPPAAYARQRATPVRAIFSQPLYDPSKEADVMGTSGVPPNPALQLKGPLPAPAHHDGAVTAMAWLDLPARLLVTGAADGTVRLWR